MFVSRSAKHSNRFLALKVTLFLVGGGAGIAGMALNIGWLVTVAICVVAAAFLLRFAPSRPIVRDNPKRRRYEVTVDGERAMLTYARRPGTIELIHTEVPVALRHHGLAALLARRALDDARAAGVRVIATCPYVKAFVADHPEYQPLLLRPDVRIEGNR